jgi:hypothetical protein
MKKIAFLVGVATLMATMMTMVYAQDKAPAGKAAPAPAPKAAEKAAPAPAPKGDDKGAPPAGAPAKADPKADMMAKKPEPAPAPAAPTPSPALLEAGKAMQGTWKCEGKVMMGGERPSVSVMKVKLELDNFWLAVTMEEKKSKTTPMPYKATGYRTFDGKKWRSIGLDNMGGWGQASSDGPKDGKVQWDGKSEAPGMGTWMTRDYEEMKGPKEFHMWGEMSQDGKTYQPVYDITCKK